jgi:CelD/BcsL family acetyltransferase involved in cellulose biosynthesis
LNNVVKISSVINEAQFLSLQDQWNSLADECETDSVFLRHEWFDAAWQWLKRDNKLLILSVVRNDEPIGFWPLVKHRKKFRKTTLRTIEFITIPDTQVCDVICSPENKEIVVDALTNYLGANWRTWDLCNLEKLPSNSKTAHYLQTSKNDSKLSFDVEQTGDNPLVTLTGVWSEYYARRSKRLRKGNNLVANRLKKQFRDVRVCWYRAKDMSQECMTQTLGTVIDISSRSWKSEIGKSLECAGPGAFIKRLTAHAYKHDWLSIWTLELDGRPAAMEYQLSYAGHVHALRGDFDLELSDQSPGTYLNWKLLEELFGEELLRYHMGPGNNAYKMRWADESSHLCKATAFSASPRGRIMSVVERKLHPFAKKLAANTKGYLTRGA